VGSTSTQQIPAFAVQQVKEKYGHIALLLPGRRKHSQIVRLAERLSSACEDCGKPAKTNYSAWIYALCDDCRNRGPVSSSGWLNRALVRGRHSGTRRFQLSALLQPSLAPESSRLVHNRVDHSRRRIRHNLAKTVGKLL